MNVDIYRSDLNPNCYVFVQRNAVINSILPDKIKGKVGDLTHLKYKKLNQNDQPLMGVSAQEIIRNIEKKGYFIQGVKIKSDVSEVGAAIGAGILFASFGTPLVVTAGAALAGYLVAHKLNDNNNKIINI